MFICFFDIEGIVHEEFVPPGQTEWKILLRCSEVTEGKHLAQTSRQVAQWPWTLHHENAPAYTSLFVQQFLPSTNKTVIPHPPYSPDLASCDFCLFPKMKLKLQWQYFDSTEEIQTKSQDVMKMLTRNDFKQCFQPWKSHWNHSINAEGDYFKEDGGE